MAKKDLASGNGSHHPIVAEDLVFNLLVKVKIIVGDDGVDALPDLTKPYLLERQHQSSTEVAVNQSFLGRFADLLCIA